MVHIRLNPSYYKNTLKNKRLFGQSQSPGAWGSSVCLPRLSPLYSCPFLSELQLFLAHLDRTLNKTREDLIPSHFPQEEYIQLQQPIVWIMITAPEEEERVEKGEGGRKVRNLTEQTFCERKQPPASKDAEHGSNLIIIQVTL